MKLVIVGVGEIGYYLAEIMLAEGHDLILVEKDEVKYRYAREHLDAQIILGDGADALVLEPLVDEDTDVIVAVTDHDATNVVATLIARKFGVKRAITRISRSSNLIHPLLTDDPCVSVLNAEMIVARELSRLIGNPHADDVGFFASGKAEMIRVHVHGDAGLVSGKRIKDIQIPASWLFIARIREGDFSIASGETELQAGDQVLMVGDPKRSKDVETLFGLQAMIVRRVIIIGYDEVSKILAKTLARRNIEVRLIEENRERAEQAAAALEKALVLQGDAANDDILEQAGIDQTDYFLALTSDDENNVLLSLLAKEKRVQRVIALAIKTQYKTIIEKMGIDLVLNPRAAMVDEIVRSIHKDDLSGVTIFEGGRGRIIDIEVKKKTRFVDVPLAKVKWPKQVLVGGIIRGDQLIIPRGDSHIQIGDHILVFTTRSVFSEVKRLFA